MTSITPIIKKRFLILLISIFIVSVSGCRRAEIQTPGYADGVYFVRVLILTGNALTAREAGGHFRQSWNLTTEVFISADPADDSIAQADCIYIAADFLNQPGLKWEVLLKNLEKAARHGAIIYFEPDCVLNDGITAAGIERGTDSEPFSTAPTIRPFPPLLRKFERFFTHLFTSPVEFSRTHYETTHMPGFVVTNRDVPVWEIDYRTKAQDASVLAIADNGQPLLTWRSYGRGGFMWSFDFSRRGEKLHGVTTIRDFALGYPDPDAANFHFGGAGLDYLFRHLLVDLAAKNKFGYSIHRVPGPNGAPCCAWQNHLDGYDNWDRNFARRWSGILLDRGLIPSFTVRSDLTHFDWPEFAGKEAAAAEFVQFCKNAGIPVNMHLTFEPLDTPETETERIRRDIQGLERIGVHRRDLTGVDHHVFYTHAKPVWQSYHTLLKEGFHHDFGGATLSNFDLFPWFFCTSSAYLPFSPPFMLENESGELLPLVIGSPLPSRPSGSAIGSRSAFPSEFRMPVSFYFHPEFIVDSNTFDDLHPEFQAMICDMENLRDVYGYCPVTESQAASAHIANRTARISAIVLKNSIVIESDSTEVWSQAGSFRDALGVRIEFAAESKRALTLKTDAAVSFFHPSDDFMEVRLNPSGKTIIGDNAVESFRFERINVPFQLELDDDRIICKTSEPGIRWFRYSWNPDDRTIWLPDPVNGSIRIFNTSLEFFEAGSGPLEIVFRSYAGDALVRHLLELKGYTKEVPADPAIRIIDFGTADARPFYKRGWCLIDEVGDDRSFVWSTGYLFSELAIPMSGVNGFDCTLDLHPYYNSALGIQSIGVEVNGTSIMLPVDLKNEWHTITFQIPSELLFRGLNSMTFRYEYVSIPALNHPGSRDMRPLAVKFDRFVLTKRETD